MATYQVNRGVGRSVEFFGLRAQYVMYLVLLVFFIIIFSFILSIFLNAVLALFIGVIAFLLALWSCYFLNNNYGVNGLTQKLASKSVVRHISVTKRVYQIVKDKNEEI